MRCEAQQFRTAKPRGKWFTLALAEAGRLYGVKNATDGERRLIADMLDAGVTVRETVDRIFAPNAPAWNDHGGLAQFFATV